MSLLDNIAKSLGYINPIDTDIEKFVEKKIQAEKKFFSKESREDAKWQQATMVSLPKPPEKKASDYIKAYRGYVFRCIEARSKELGNIKLHLYKRKGTEYLEIEEHPLLDLLYKINPFMSQSMFFEMTQAYKDLSGEAFWWKIRDESGNIVELWPLRPDWVDVIPSKDEFIAGYLFKAGGSPDPKDHIKLPFKDVLHFKTFNPENPYRGLSIVKASAIEIDSYDFSAEYNRNFFYNAARPGGTLTTEQNLKPETRRRIEDEWNAKYSGRANAFKVAILEGGLKWDDTGFTQKDMDFSNLKTMSRDDIMALFQVPKTIIAISDDVNRANAREARAVFQEFVIDPLMKSVVGFMNEFLVNEYDEDLFLDYDPPAPVDQHMNLKYYESGIKNSWLKINEVREAENLEVSDDPRADGLLIPNTVSFLGVEEDNNEVNTDTDNPDDSGDSNNSEDETDKSNKRKRNFNLTPPPRPINERIQERVKEKVKGILSKEASPALREIMKLMMTTNDVSSKEFKDKAKVIAQKYNTKHPLLLDRQMKEAYWKEFTKRADNYETIYKSKVRRLFVKQEAEVLSRLKKADIGKSMKKSAIEKSVGSIIFDVSEEGQLFSRVLLPILHDLIKAQGKDIMDFLKADDVFEGDLQRIQNYLDEQGGGAITEINSETRKQIISELQEGIANGEGTDSLADRVQNVYSSATRSRAETIARTETIRAANFATEEAFKQSKVVLKKEWLTSRDERVCEFCAPQDGKIINLDDEFYRKGESQRGLNGGLLKFGLYDVKQPPLHPNCRCTLLPVTEDDPSETSFKNSQRVKDTFDLEGLEGVSQAQRNEKTKQIFTKNFEWASATVENLNWKLNLVDFDEVSVHSWQVNDNVERYMSNMRSGDKFPPMLAIKGVDDKDKYTILDGAHRSEALKRLGADRLFLLTADPEDFLKHKTGVTKINESIKIEKFVPERAKELIEKGNLNPEQANFRAMVEYIILYYELDITIPAI